MLSCRDDSASRFAVLQAMINNNYSHFDRLTHQSFVSNLMVGLDAVFAQQYVGWLVDVILSPSNEAAQEAEDDTAMEEDAENDDEQVHIYYPWTRLM